ncbi:valine--tRNA ligase [Eilatimonas milleporae]|uniref:Valine--tRNA ligase n=1 Tax=Eilatimonas milleporae TaxID=911205 RepID=A0A3M0C701_9PROT|nr:valine--tRNA ligase [Eilatimonas milleporae]RMB05002.1 valyl-tRNA synthetase [Eilatimonas milleporae]
MNTTYAPADIEEKWYLHWEKSGLFAADEQSNAVPYAIVMPPPNVTGNLHMGHALDNTLQDVLVRFERLRGKNVLWQPGTDHAGIATQMVVERMLDKEGVKRAELGREAFLERVWEWKQESGGAITGQLRRLGASCDWSREAFTMDDPRQEAVTQKFVQLYRDGLIYRDKRLVNWDPKLKTAISDLEVEQKEVDGHFWHFRYPIDEEGGRFIVIATTRPETMLGDTAVAVHPDDERYRDLVGKQVRLPLTDRLIPIVADDWADPEQGSGAVKITPAHDFNDFAVGQRHDLPMINIFDSEACLSDAVPEKYCGMDRFEARKAVVADMETLGLVEKIEAHTHMVPYGDRSGVVVEPWLTDQWYVDAATLAGPAIEAVEDGRTRFVPKTWEKTYFEWMRNIQPWCVSRQLWWGHRIPAWYAGDGSVFVAETEADAYREARKKLGDDVRLERDGDVLDTWFSSAMWPYSTLGWPEKTPALETFYPGATLVTGFDIIFFWVARMMMSGLYFMGDVPFKTVYIHALVRDAKGQKMSKSKGNVIDPINFIDKYGADALRFTLAAMEAQGRDIKLDEKRVEGYRNFGTKLWNAARFCQMNGVVGGADGMPPPATSAINKWIIAEVAGAARTVTKGLDAFRFNDAAGTIYHFVWGTFCDWYLELIKPVFYGDDEALKAETRAVTGWILDRILILLHPFMPFITEELWHGMSETRPCDLIRAEWPVLEQEDDAAGEEVNWLIRFISEIRSTRSEMNVPAGAKPAALIVGASQETTRRLRDWQTTLCRLARLDRADSVAMADAKDAAQLVVDEATVYLPLAGVMDLDAEKARLAKVLDKLNKDAGALRGRLSNEKFLAKAPADVVADAKEQLSGLEEQGAKIKAALERLG